MKNQKQATTTTTAAATTRVFENICFHIQKTVDSIFVNDDLKNFYKTVFNSAFKKFPVFTESFLLSLLKLTESQYEIYGDGFSKNDFERQQEEVFIKNLADRLRKCVKYREFDSFVDDVPEAELNECEKIMNDFIKKIENLQSPTPEPTPTAPETKEQPKRKGRPKKAQAPTTPAPAPTQETPAPTPAPKRKGRPKKAQAPAPTQETYLSKKEKEIKYLISKIEELRDYKKEDEPNDYLGLCMKQCFITQCDELINRLNSLYETGLIGYGEASCIKYYYKKYNEDDNIGHQMKYLKAMYENMIY